jgi:pyridoxamine 5'-phosphate oxidase family protein
MIFTDAEMAYFRAQPIGRLATVAPDGVVQNNPVFFQVDAELGVIDIGGHNMGASKKFRNIERGSAHVALVVDEVISIEQQRVRGIEIRGLASAMRDQSPLLPGFSGELLRIRPQLIFSWSINPDTKGMQRRVVAGNHRARN